jgi:hypothetical protein
MLQSAYVLHTIMNNREHLQTTRFTVLALTERYGRMLPFADKLLWGRSGSPGGRYEMRWFASGEQQRCVQSLPDRLRCAWFLCIAGWRTTISRFGSRFPRAHHISPTLDPPRWIQTAQPRGKRVSSDEPFGGPKVTVTVYGAAMPA